MDIFVKDIVNIMDDFAPVALAQEWDNVGLLIGNYNQKVNKVLLALDLLDSVIDEAIENNANHIITHHPPFFGNLYNINSSNPLGSKILRLLENKISLYVSHTNLDAADGGINDILFDIFELKNKEYICEQPNGAFIGRAGNFSRDINLKELSLFVQKKLNLPYAIYCGNPIEIAKKIAIVGGSAANEGFFNSVLSSGCNVFITSDIKFHAAQKALEMGINLIDATHFGSESIFANNLKKYISDKLNIECLVSKVDGQVFKNGENHV